MSYLYISVNKIKRKDSVFPCRWIFLCLLLALNACSPGQLEMEDVTAPNAGPFTRLSRLSADPDGKIYLSWVEAPPEKPSRLLFSRWQEDKWTEPQEITRGTDWFVNWADFPGLVANRNGDLLAWFLQKSGEGTYAYDVMVTLSEDDGETWSTPFVVHHDGTPTEHGFVSGIPLNEDQFLLTWLDGRYVFGDEGGHGEGDHGHSLSSTANMSLRTAILNTKGEFIAEKLVDTRVCDCCQTDLVATPDGALTFYRNRDSVEVRDIGMITWKDGHWDRPRIVYPDEWQIPGCPVNGPQAASQGEQIALAWFTMEADSARVKVIFSNDGGTTFGSPIRIDEGDPLGRVDIGWMAEDRAVVVWMEAGEEEAEIRIRDVFTTGEVGKSQLVSTVPSARSSGFPRMVSTQTEALLTWTQGDSIPTVAVTRLKIK